MIAAALAAAVAWNLATWARGLPASSGHALVGGLVGAGLVAGGAGIVNWDAVAVMLVALAFSPMLGALAGFGWRSGRCAARGGARRGAGAGPFAAASWATSAALAFGHGANDAQKSVGVIAALLVADGRASDARLADVGGGGVRRRADARHRARRLADRAHDRARDRAAAPARRRCRPGRARPAVIVAASALGAPVSTTQVVASTVVGVGGGRRRWRHVHWAVVREMALGWVVTLPVTAALARRRAGAWEVWR